MRVFLFISLFLLVSACQQSAVPSLSPKLDAQKATLKKMSEALKKSGDMQSAAVVEQNVILLDQKDEGGFIELSKTLTSIGKKDEAKDVLKTGIEVLPSSDRLKIELARIYLNEFDQKPAIEVLEKSANKETKDYYGLMGVAADLDDDNSQAKSYYRKGLEIDSKDENIRNNLAMSYILTAEYGDAVKILEDLVKDPAVAQKYKPKYRQNLALAYGLSGRNEKALQALEKDLGPKLARENVELYKTMRGDKKAVQKTAVKKIAVEKAAPKASVKPEAISAEKPQAIATPEVKSETMPAPDAVNENQTKPTARSTKAYLSQ